MILQDILRRPLLNQSEILLLALYPPSYDPETGIVSKSAFKKNNTSASRKAVLKVDDILEILKAELSKPDRPINAYGCIDVEEVKSSVIDPEVVFLEVTEDPTPANCSHAEIIAFGNSSKASFRKDVPNGVAKNLCRKLRVHS
ncbi:hypothetical protein [Halomonas sp. HAL1]|uniref:hypothetical protein n=1 Tax=Halomonas sp. HAL1 TaxID=550984 RepID=UPI00111284E1|nr:hypothetical protein [Halomonas sp. HAL1]WKV93307.1 hypothetical protein Q3Y66_01315 [Halomonas sp. HAL1]